MVKDKTSPNQMCIWSSYHFFLSLSLFKIFIGIQLIYNVVLVSGVQQNESVTHIHIFTLFLILFPHRPLQSIEENSLGYIVSPY